jgi:hypothetical protein
MPFALAELSGLATRGDHGTAGEQPPQPHLYGSDLGGIAPSDYPMFESLLPTQSRSPIYGRCAPVADIDELMDCGHSNELPDFITSKLILQEFDHAGDDLRHARRMISY